MKETIKKWTPYLLIIIFAFIIVFPQIKSNAYIIGIDSIFHMNRFYDAAMQLKTGHFSYFQSFFGFQHSGRIINALYGPLFAYVNGAILLVVGSWVKYQVISSLAIMIISGCLMYHLAIYNHANRFSATVVSLIYILSDPIFSWVSGQQFTGWGAAFLPWLMLSGSQMLREHKVHIIQLALSMTILLQTHIMSSLVGTIALIPFFIVGWMHANNRFKMFRDGVLATLLTLVLSGNVYGGMFDIYSSNRLISVAPQADLDQDALAIFQKQDTILNPVYLILFLLTLVFLIWAFKRISTSLKTITIVGLVFLWVSSFLFPWNTLSSWFPSITYLIQMPKRFDVIAYILLLTSISVFFSNLTIKMVSPIVKNGFLLISFGILFFQATSIIHEDIKDWNSIQVVSNNHDMKFQTADPKALRESLTSNNLSDPLYLMTKATPDYLPIKEQLLPIGSIGYYNFHPYGNYDRQVILRQLHYPLTEKVYHSNELVVSWMNHRDHHHQKGLPVIKYAHTVVTFNGKTLQHPTTSNIGSVIVNAKPGWNQVTLTYEAGLFFKLTSYLTWVGWLSLLAFAIQDWIKKIALRFKFKS
ncbi:hypothetical protein WR164_04690 [Philodulcilactobacillus myokoensis]|uniref:Cell division protein n=1 Tax=Philodulcilactobacillus myokoensis TaxID=2929573 RepID=A0A9W6ES62_9LACO|nr:hypothetical protein [Philodulcilactobacillus myokoensis]GLB46490.1 hypothetical protein WR164_04690 [Philodulcilactobacillus myokoensis]